ncbi:hypothetical protein DFH27DRAFT_602580 [Peziza echinospora]|nr:hypothetical protein DFH27DRAFT_602580 [Peziza echinospora]
MTLPRDVTQTLVDELILDYLLHACITALIAEWDASNVSSPQHAIPQHLAEISSKADRALLLVNSFLRIYQSRSNATPPPPPLPRDIRFRYLLCRFLCLFLRRIDPASTLARSPQTTILRIREDRRGRVQKYMQSRALAHIFPNDLLRTDFIVASSSKTDAGGGGKENTIHADRRRRYYFQRFGVLLEDGEGDGGYAKTGGGGGGGDGVEGFQKQPNLEPEKEKKESENSSNPLLLPPHITSAFHDAAAATAAAVPGSTTTIRGTASLADSLPLFMLLTAWTSAQVSDSPISELWMAIATSFMTHAFAEEFLCHGTPAEQALNECFAWGVVPVDEHELFFDRSGNVNNSSSSGTGGGGGGGGDTHERRFTREMMDEFVISEMFSADEGEVSKAWERARRRAIVELVPRASDGWGEGGFEGFLVGKITKSTTIASGGGGEDGDEGNTTPTTTTPTNNNDSNDLRALQRNVVEGYVSAVMSAVSTPVLAQLERGRLKGVEGGMVEGVLRRAGAFGY